jgi:uncharacterized protein (DUF58 family)
MIKFIIASILLLLVAILLNLYLLVLGIYSVLGLLMVCRWVTDRWAQGVAATRNSIATRLNVGDQVSVAVDVAHVGNIPIGWILVDDLQDQKAFQAKVPAITVKGDCIGVAQLAPGAIFPLRYKIKFHRRGYYQS